MNSIPKTKHITKSFKSNQRQSQRKYQNEEQSSDSENQMNRAIVEAMFHSNNFQYQQETKRNFNQEEDQDIQNFLEEQIPGLYNSKEIYENEIDEEQENLDYYNYSIAPQYMRMSRIQKQLYFQKLNRQYLEKLNNDNSSKKLKKTKKQQKNRDLKEEGKQLQKQQLIQLVKIQKKSQIKDQLLIKNTVKTIQEGQQIIVNDQNKFEQQRINQALSTESSVAISQLQSIDPSIKTKIIKNNEKKSIKFNEIIFELPFNKQEQPSKVTQRQQQSGYIKFDSQAYFLQDDSSSDQDINITMNRVQSGINQPILKLPQRNYCQNNGKNGLQNFIPILPSYPKNTQQLIEYNRYFNVYGNQQGQDYDDQQNYEDQYGQYRDSDSNDDNDSDNDEDFFEQQQQDQFNIMHCHTNRKYIHKSDSGKSKTGTKRMIQEPKQYVDENSSVSIQENHTITLQTASPKIEPLKHLNKIQKTKLIHKNSSKDKKNMKKEFLMAINSDNDANLDDDQNSSSNSSQSYYLTSQSSLQQLELDQQNQHFQQKQIDINSMTHKQVPQTTQNEVQNNDAMPCDNNTFGISQILIDHSPNKINQQENIPQNTSITSIAT